MKKISIAAALVLLGSCGTPEFQAAQSTCAAEWTQKIPPQYEQEIYQRTESRQVPTGQTKCEVVGTATICNPVMRTEYYTVPAVRTVDRNQERRDIQIRACTQTACIQQYGNPQCKTE